MTKYYDDIPAYLITAAERRNYGPVEITLLLTTSETLLNKMRALEWHITDEPAYSNNTNFLIGSIPLFMRYNSYKTIETSSDSYGDDIHWITEEITRLIVIKILPVAKSDHTGLAIVAFEYNKSSTVPGNIAQVQVTLDTTDRELDKFITKIHNTLEFAEKPEQVLHGMNPFTGEDYERKIPQH